MFLFASTVALWIATWRGANDNAKSLAAIERAYIFFDFHDAFELKGSGTRIEVEVRAQNGGKTPGTVFECYGGYAEGDALPARAEYGDPKCLIQTRVTIPTNYTLPVGTIILHNPREIEFVYGYIRYIDIFDKTRTTAFAAKIDRKSGAVEALGGDEWNYSN